MSESDSTIPDVVRGALLGSGFPFQTAIAQLLNPAIGWQLSASEHPWQTPSGDDQFLDIVATNGVLSVCIECKKTRKETLTFLRPLGLSHTGIIHEVRCLRAKQISDSTKRAEMFCETWDLLPPSTVSEFCVVSTSDSRKDRRMLEHDARSVVRATDAFAHYFKGRFDPNRDRLTEACLFLPLLVTNAAIYTARYRPADVSLETGEFVALPKEIEPTPWVRFRKAFTSDSGPDLGDRTVFVVQAVSLVDFLRALSPAIVQPDPSSVHYLKPPRR